MVREDRLDVAFMACTHKIPDMHSRIIWRDRLLLAMPEAHPLAQRDRITWQDLAAETFLVREGGAGPHVHDLIVLRAAGQGISLFVAENLTLVPPGIVAREIADKPESVAFCAIWSPSNQSQILRNLLGLAGRLGREMGRSSTNKT